MRLRSNHVLPPISEYVPRRRRRTRSASAQAGTESATESAPEIAQEAVPESQSASDVAEQSAAERPAPRRKPAKRAGRKKKAAAKGKKAAAPTAEPEAEPQEDPVTLIPSVEQPDAQPTRKRNRSSEDDEDPSSKRHKLTLQTPPGFENRPRGSSRRTYAERARRREAERNGRIDRTIYRFPQLLAQQGEDARSGNSTALASDASEEPASRGNRIVPFSSSPSALPQDQNQNQNQNQNRLGWREWIFNSVTGLWGRGNVPQTAQVPQVAEPQRPIGNEPSSSVATPSSAPPSSAVLPRNLESPTPRPRVAEPQTSNSRLTASARAPQAGKRKKYSYDLDPQGFDPELLARMRARKSNPAALQPPPTSPQQPDTLSENESKKRKREPSPDVIPHPPGCSYGFDPQYFIYDIDDEDLTAGEQAGQDTTPKRATVCGASEKEHASKRARQDITPKRATGSIAAEEEPIPKHAIPDNTHLHNLNHQGPSKLMDDSSEELRKARQLAEQYKPKTPSRLRAALRFESSWSSYVDEEADQDAVRRRKMRKTSMATACPTGDLTEILWPEEETWIDRFDWHDRNLAKYQKVFSPYAYGGDRDYFDIKHEDFMDRLAARRA